jgi:hypothetical protein
MKFHSTRVWSAFGAAILFPIGLVHAQESARHVRFLPLGDPPPYMQEIRDGVAYEIDPPEGTLPPREVVVGNPKPGEEGTGSTGDDSAKPMSLRLGSVTSAAKVPGGEGVLQLRRAADVAPQLPWLSIKRPAQGDFMVYLWRRTGAPTWNEISHLVVPDGPVGAPAGTVRWIGLEDAVLDAEQAFSEVQSGFLRRGHGGDGESDAREFLADAVVEVVADAAVFALADAYHVVFELAADEVFAFELFVCGIEEFRAEFDLFFEGCGEGLELAFGEFALGDIVDEAEDAA